MAYPNFPAPRVPAKYKRQYLMDTLIDVVIREQGYEINATQIFTTARVAKGTFYRHFGSADDILIQTYYSGLSDYLELYRDLPHNHPPFDLVNAIFNLVRPLFKYDNRFLIILYYPHLRQELDSNPKIAPLITKLYELIQDMVYEARLVCDTGLLAEVPATDFLDTVLKQVVHDWLSNGKLGRYDDYCATLHQWILGYPPLKHVNPA